jgi:flagellar biogenesis protein FliO
MSDARVVERPMVGGFAGFVIELVRRGRSGLGVARAEKSLKVVEVLQLGGKRQVMLVACGEQRFLVGAGAEGVSAIVPVDAGEVQS